MNDQPNNNKVNYLDDPANNDNQNYQESNRTPDNDQNYRDAEWRPENTQNYQNQNWNSNQNQNQNPDWDQNPNQGWNSSQDTNQNPNWNQNPNQSWNSSQNQNPNRNPDQNPDWNPDQNPGRNGQTKIHSGYSTAALVCGIVSLVMAFSCLFTVFSFIPAIAGIILALIAKSKTVRWQDTALGGFITSIIALVIFLILIVSGIVLYNCANTIDSDSFIEEYNDNGNDVF